MSKINFKKIVEDYKTKYTQGFIESELKDLCKQLNIKESDLNEALGTNTCMLIDDDVITYWCDVENAVSKIFTGSYLFFD